MIDIKRKLKNFGPLEALVISSITYVILMLLWTASTRSEVLQKANDIKSNHKLVVDFIIESNHQSIFEPNLEHLFETKPKLTCYSKAESNY